MSWEEQCRSFFIEHSEACKITFSKTEVDQMVKFGALLMEWNQKMNLTRITDPEEVALKHMLDSAVGASLLPQGAKVIDVGTGAGFPGVVLKIMRPDIQVVLLDSLKKRLTFLQEVIQSLGLTGIETCHERAETGGRQKELREQFDVAVARAVAALPLLSEYCLPFVKPKGIFLAWKGPKGREEVKEGEKAFSILKGKVKEIYEFDFPGTDEKRLIIELIKTGRSDAKYPRKPGSTPL